MNASSFILLLMLILLILHKLEFAGVKGIFEDALSLKNTIMIRGAAAVCVILTHTGVIPFYKHGFLFVGIFFFISGYGLMLSLKKKPGYLKVFFRNRLPSVIVPYYTMNIFYIIALFGLGFTPTIDMVFRSFFLPMMKRSLFITSAWYVIAIVLFYVFFGIFFRYFKFFKAFLLTALGIAIYCMLCRHFGRSISWYGTTSLFLLGILFAQYYSKIYAIIRKKHFILSILMLLLFINGVVVDHQARGLLKFFTHQISCSFFVLFIITLLYKFHIKSSLLAFWGKVSYELYIAHHLVILFLNNSTINPPWKNSVYCLHWDSQIGVALSTVAIATLIAFIMNRINQKILNSLKKYSESLTVKS